MASMNALRSGRRKEVFGKCQRTSTESVGTKKTSLFRPPTCSYLHKPLGQPSKTNGLDSTPPDTISHRPVSLVALPSPLYCSTEAHAPAPTLPRGLVVARAQQRTNVLG
ncbi:uncharacterized protein K452DRAFT_282250 [Aplosporella prunicola CBS 121167]|uniref:Uncharacterized protein n=1 Tax=Aplosporella prunicola CBS 121167 TaxID=1176127 RepID=A0A6A6BT12_9PEZI|nr:uncharacterized protein K452DRAFT_282250 [Aplosporella prunicola CBS 121167]KAF2147262.1 hypothetical protein K452DRAFT_282250 [Aplosporella prunicola CBS 121167]